MRHFWQGFEKRANELRNPALLGEESVAPAESASPGGGPDPRKERPVLKDSITSGGARLDTLTSESDRGKHESFKG